MEQMIIVEHSNTPTDAEKEHIETELYKIFSRYE